MCATEASAAEAVQAESFAEYQIKAAFIHKFALFAKWPQESFDTPLSPVVLTIFGKDTFNESINDIKEENVANRKLVIRYTDNIEELDGSHIVFICESEIERIKDVLEYLDNKPVLTVTDAMPLYRSGVMIYLFVQGKNVRFWIDKDKVFQSGILMQARLLRLSTVPTE